MLAKLIIKFLLCENTAQKIVLWGHFMGLNFDIPMVFYTFVEIY